MNDMMLLIEPLIPALRRYAYSLLRDRAAADDLLQDCLERAIGRWQSELTCWCFRPSRSRRRSR